MLFIYFSRNTNCKIQEQCQDPKVIIKLNKANLFTVKNFTIWSKLSICDFKNTFRKKYVLS